MGMASVAAAVLYFKQESLLYFPEIGGVPRRPGDNPRGYRSPAERQIPFDSVRMVGRDGVEIHGWLLKYSTNGESVSPETPTILFFHGNAGNIGLRLPNAMKMVQELQSNVLLVEYRGYGESDGKPTEKGLKLDAQAALDYTRQRNDLGSRIYAFGRSLGGAVAMDLARYAESQNQPLTGLMVENTFTSISDMVDVLLPMLTPIKRFVLKIGWRSDEIVTQLRQTPILYLAGSQDELVPPAQMQRLYQLSTQQQGPPPSWYLIEGGTHNESWYQGGLPYWKAIRQFLGQKHQIPAAAKDTVTQEEYVIPIMGNNFVDIAKDVTSAASGRHSSSRTKQE